MSIFYLPKDGVCGDFIPYYNTDRACYELYYLHDYRGEGQHTEGTDWRRITTTDMVHFNEEGTVILRGDAKSRDLFCYTGCVVVHNGVQHIFYTGHNYHLMETGGRKEAVMHAVSTDGVHWQKREELTFCAPEGLDIELNDWRDPYVLYNEEESCWQMLLCTRKKTGPDRLRGATGLLKSNDLNSWHYEGSFWSPSNCWCPECPELFRWGSYWYFIYSTFCEEEGFRTYYRIGESANGPWRAPAHNTFDSRAFYAGKTASDGKRRFIFGWNPTKQGDVDSGVWQWGGCLAAHELYQTENGELRVKLPEELRASFHMPQELHFEPFLSKARYIDGILTVSVPSGFAEAKALQKLPEKALLEAEIYLEPGTQSAGLILHSDEQGDEGYCLRLESEHGLLAFDRIHRLCEHNEHERSIPIGQGCWHKLQVLLDGTAMTAYLDGAAALSARLYDYKQSGLMAFAADGTAHFRNVRFFAEQEGGAR